MNTFSSADLKELKKDIRDDCRRTYATLEYLNGTDIKVIKMQLGHKTEAQTWEYIVDVAEFAQRQDKLKGIGLNLTEFETILVV